MIGGADLKLMADDVARGYRRAGFQVFSTAFRYTSPLSTIAGINGGDTQQISTDRDSLFVWLSTSITFFNAGGAHQWFDSFSLQIRDDTAGWELVGPDRFLPSQIIAGEEGAAVVLGFPYIMPPGTRLSVAWRDNGALGSARLSLNGIKLFTKPYTRRVIMPDVPGAEAV